MKGDNSEDRRHVNLVTFVVAFFLIFNCILATIVTVFILI